MAQKGQLIGMHTDVWVDLQVLSDQLDLSVRVLNSCSQPLLDGLNLLRHGTKNAFLQTIELVKASPRADLTQTKENTAHGLEIECLVTTEYEDKPSELHTKCLDRLGFSYLNSHE